MLSFANLKSVPCMFSVFLFVKCFLPQVLIFICLNSFIWLHLRFSQRSRLLQLWLTASFSCCFSLRCSGNVGTSLLVFLLVSSGSFRQHFYECLKRHRVNKKRLPSIHKRAVQKSISVAQHRGAIRNDGDSGKPGRYWRLPLIGTCIKADVNAVIGTMVFTTDSTSETWSCIGLLVKISEEKEFVGGATISLALVYVQNNFFLDLFIYFCSDINYSEIKLDISLFYPCFIKKAFLTSLRHNLCRSWSTLKRNPEVDLSLG